LENRTLMTASISVSNAFAIEGGNTMNFLDHFVSPGSGGLSTARSSVFGPDGNLYVASADTNAILRYDPTGQFINAFVPSSSGGLSSPWDLVFGPDGDLYVPSKANNEVLRYDGSSGAFLGVVASGLSTPGGLAFGADGSLYIANLGTNEVLRYNSSGLSAFVTAGSGGLSQPFKAVFGPDGNLYVASKGTGQVLRYDGATGAFKDVFASLPSSFTGVLAWLEFGTDGYLYVAARGSATSLNVSILRFNATTGSFVDSFALGRDGWSFNLGAGNIVYDSSNGDNNDGGFVDRIGASSIAVFTVSLGQASAGTTTVHYATADGTALAGSDYIAVSGTLTFPPGLTSQTIVVQTLDDGRADATKYFTINLSNPVGGVITSSQGIGAILDSGNIVPMTVSAADWTSAGLTLTLGSDGNLHVYTTTGTTTDVVPPSPPASGLGIDIASPSDTTASLTIDSTNGDPVPPGGLDFNGAGGLIITGPGSVTLSGTNTYTGGTTVSSGTLLINAASALPGGTSLTVGAGGTFVFDPSQSASSVSAAGLASPAPGIAASSETSAPIDAARALDNASVSASAVSTLSTFLERQVKNLSHVPASMSSVANDAVFASHRSVLDRTVSPAVSAQSTISWAWLAAIESSGTSSDQNRKTDSTVAALDMVLARFGV